MTDDLSKDMTNDLSKDMTNDLSKVAARIAKAVQAVHAAKTPITVARALTCVEPAELAPFFHDALDPGAAAAIAEGLPASPGAGSGEIVFSSQAALAATDAGRQVILVRNETTPDDVVAIQVATGVLTTRGGLTSHAAVVARDSGIPAVVGVTEIHIDNDVLVVGDLPLHAGDVITIDGNSGAVYLGAQGTTRSEPPGDLDLLLHWADEVNAGHVQVQVNADTADGANLGLKLGAQGIGLCRTEHMFLATDRLLAIRRFILADDDITETAALAVLERAQEADFAKLLEAAGSLPVTVRLLDPPLHEFLPDLAKLVEREAAGSLCETEALELAAVRRLSEANPMLGTRGVRLGAVRPGLYEMQVRALCSAAIALFDQGLRPTIGIMIPFVVDAQELRIARDWVSAALDDVDHPGFDAGIVTVGAMVETPRAALTAGALAEHADFFSFGTNDLTQMTFAFSRDDVEAKLLPAYQHLGILDANPFAVLDQDGVGALVQQASSSARQTNPKIKLGACGEHAGDPVSAAFLVRSGMDSVSCSPFRVPMARLAVAQSLLACGRVNIDDVDFTFPESASASANAVDPDTPTLPSAEPIDEKRVLHTLGVRGFVTGEGFAASLGLTPTDILDSLVARGLVRHLEARDMYGLLPAGQVLHAQQLSAAHDQLAASLGPTYHRDFLPLNEEVKKLCSAWQMRSPSEPNDHTDLAYDTACVEKLLELVHHSGTVIGGFAESLPRLARYQTRLVDAVTAVRAGEVNRFTGVMCESFHDIWMELHQDLILLQDIDRADEGSF